jgi:hypothetical protein
MGMRLAHLSRDRTRDLDLHQITFADTRAPLARFAPVFLVANQFGPERKRRALQRLGFVDRTAAVLEKFALGMSRNTQPPDVFCPVNITALERGRSHLEKCRQPGNIVFRQINEALLFTAFRAAGLAGEAHPWGCC